LSLSPSPAFGPCGIPPDPDADDEGAGVELEGVVWVGAGAVEVAAWVGAAVVVAACVGAAVVEVAGGGGAAVVVVAAGTGVVAVEAATGCKEPAVFALAVFALAVFALVCFALWALAAVVLCAAAGCDALVVEVAAAAEALVTVEELDELDPQPAAARQARTSPQLARPLIDRVMAVPISVCSSSVVVIDGRYQASSVALRGLHQIGPRPARILPAERGTRVGAARALDLVGH
jgi:hypothetical protein